jgi:hypothetical protein
MNILDLAKQTKALAEKATPGPYYVGHMSEEYDTLDIHESEKGVLVAESVGANDFKFWNHTRTAAPALADAVIEMVEALKATTIQLHRCLMSFEKNWAIDWDEGKEARDSARELLTKLGITTEGE